MISVNTPKVPSEPTKRLVRSYPAEDFIAIPPVRITVPSASTTSSPKTWSRITPYRTAFVPLTVCYARLDPGDKVLGHNLQDLVHQAKVQAYAAAEGDGVPLQAAPLSVGHHGDSAPVGEAQDLDDLVPFLREDHGVRGVRRVVGKDLSVALKLLPVDVDSVLIGDYVP